MPQAMLPIYPYGSTEINAILAFQHSEDGQIIYFNGSMPLFSHDTDDTASFKMITAQFCVTGSAKQMEIVRAFGVKAISVKRAVKRYRTEGARGFFKERKTRGSTVFTSKVLTQAQSLLNEGLSQNKVADQLNIKRNTFAKAVTAQRLHILKKKIP